MVTTIVATLALGLSQGEAIDFRALTLDGKEVQAAAALRGTASLIILWGPWSPQSSKALEAGLKMHDKYGASLKVVALTSWDTQQNTTAFFQQNPSLNITAWWDPAGKSTADSIAMRVFKVKRFPAVFVLDKDLHVVGSFVPYKVTDDLPALIGRAG